MAILGKTSQETEPVLEDSWSRGVSKWRSYSACSREGQPSGYDHKVQKRLRDTQQDGGYAWVILAASFSAAILRGIRAASIGVYLVEFHDRYELTWTQTTTISALQSLISQILAIPSGYAVKRFGSRISCIVGSLVLSCSYALPALLDNTAAVFIFFACLGGAGVLAFQLPVNVPVQRYFKKRLGFAMSVGATGTGVGLLLGPPLTLLLIKEYGLLGSLLVMAALFLNGCVSGCLFRPIVSSDDCATTPNSKATPKISLRELPKQFLLFLFLVLLVQIGHSAVVLFTYMRGTKLGFDENVSSLLASIVGLTALTRFIHGALVDILGLPRAVVLSAFSFLAGLSVVISTLKRVVSYLVVTQFIYGFMSAGYVALNMATMVSLVGLDKLELGNALFSIMIGVSSLFANLVTGPMMDATGKPNSPFFVFGMLMIVGAVGLLAQAIYIKRSRPEYKQFQNEETFVTDSNKTQTPD